MPNYWKYTNGVIRVLNPRIWILLLENFGFQRRVLKVIRECRTDIDCDHNILADLKSSQKGQ